MVDQEGRGRTEELRFSEFVAKVEKGEVADARRGVGGVRAERDRVRARELGVDEVARARNHRAELVVGQPIARHAEGEAKKTRLLAESEADR